MSSNVSATNITPLDDYARIERQRAFYRTFIDKYAGQSSAAGPTSTSGFGLSAKKAPGTPFLTGTIRQTGNPLLEKTNPLQPKREIPIDFNTKPEVEGPKNLVQERLFKLAVPALQQGTPVTGVDASRVIDTKELAAFRGVKVNDYAGQNFPNLSLSPYMQEMLRLFWAPNNPLLKTVDTTNNYYDNFLKDIRQNFGNVEDPTTKQGGSSGLFFGFAGGGGGGGTTSGGGENSGSSSQRRPFRFNA